MTIISDVKVWKHLDWGEINHQNHREQRSLLYKKGMSFLSNPQSHRRAPSHCPPQRSSLQGLATLPGRGCFPDVPLHSHSCSVLNLTPFSAWRSAISAAHRSHTLVNSRNPATGSRRKVGKSVSESPFGKNAKRRKPNLSTKKTSQSINLVLASYQFFLYFLAL